MVSFSPKDHLRGNSLTLSRLMEEALRQLPELELVCVEMRFRGIEVRRGARPSLSIGRLEEQLGPRLMRSACSLPDTCARECRRPFRCPYAALYEPCTGGGGEGNVVPLVRDVPRPFAVTGLVSTGPATRPELRLRMSLFGAGIDYFPFLLRALRSLVGQGGRRERGRPRPLEVRDVLLVPPAAGEEAATDRTTHRRSLRRLSIRAAVRELITGGEAWSGWLDRASRGHDGTGDIWMGFAEPRELGPRSESLQLVTPSRLATHFRRRLQALFLSHGPSRGAWTKDPLQEARQGLAWPRAGTTAAATQEDRSPVTEAGREAVTTAPTGWVHLASCRPSELPWLLAACWMYPCTIIPDAGAASAGSFMDEKGAGSEVRL